MTKEIRLASQKVYMEVALPTHDKATLTDFERFKQIMQNSTHPRSNENREDRYGGISGISPWINVLVFDEGASLITMSPFFLDQSRIAFDGNSSGLARIGKRTAVSKEEGITIYENLKKSPDCIQAVCIKQSHVSLYRSKNGGCAVFVETVDRKPIAMFLNTKTKEYINSL